MRTTTSYDDDGNLRITITLPAEQGAVVTAALEQVQAGLERQQAEELDVTAETSEAADRPGVSAETPPSRPTLADALVEMARATLDRQSPERIRRVRTQLTAQVDPVSGWARLADGELLPPGTLTKALKSLPGRGGPPRLRPLTATDLTRLDLGRTARLPSQALRDLLGTVDGERCRFPGCTRHRKLHAHHVQLWSAGGPTDLRNLVLVCGRHHTLVHQLGFSLTLDQDRRLTVTTADGVPVLHHPALPRGDRAQLDPDRHVSAETLTPDTLTHRMDLGYCVAVLMQQAA